MKRINFFKKNGWLTFGLLGLMLVTSTAATLVKVKNDRFGKFFPREEIRSYVESTVKPVLVSYRNKLDSELSASEKKKVESIRTELKALKENQKELGFAMREKRRNGEEPTAEEQNEVRKVMREIRQITQDAWDIADAHSSFYDNMFTETEDDRKKWREEIQGIMKTQMEKMKEERPDRNGRPERGQMDKKRPENKNSEERPERGGPEGKPEKGPEGEFKGGPEADFKGRPDRKGPEGGRQHRGNRGPGGFGFLGKLDPANPQTEVIFLLWDTEDSIFPEREDRPEDKAMTFPNPAFDGSKLFYKVDTKGKVQIELFNEKGDSIKKLENGQKEPGKYTLEIDVKDLQPGMYYYKITTPDDTITRKFIKKNN
ncbi:MAG: hypothetical protein CMO01_06575 [Thalassobius sp.]|nr:hypothetical protein [Thalassovita sp.]